MWLLPLTIGKVGFCHCEPVSQHWCGNPLSGNKSEVMRFSGNTDCHVAALLAMTKPGIIIIRGRSYVAPASIRY